MKQLNKKEIEHWIQFLYDDLLMDNVLIAGYYFNFQQQNELNKIARGVDGKINKILDNITNLSKDQQKSSTKSVQQRINKLYDQLNNITVTLNVKNKFDEIISLPCTVDEFHVVLQEFTKKRDSIEHFLKDNIEALQDVQEGNQEELNCFMWYLNDFVQELRMEFLNKKAPNKQHSIIKLK